MKTHEVSMRLRGKLPAPPAQREDIVKGIGWSYGPAIRRTKERAGGDLRPLLLADGEPSGLPADPSEPPPLPDPPPQQPDTEQRGGGPGGVKAR
jgi:hypothetical protein